jgi:hypothetical protein
MEIRETEVRETGITGINRIPEITRIPEIMEMEITIHTINGKD